MLLPFTKPFISGFDRRLLKNAPQSFETGLLTSGFKIILPRAVWYKNHKAPFLLFVISDYLCLKTKAIMSAINSAAPIPTSTKMPLRPNFLSLKGVTNKTPVITTAAM